MTLSFMFISVDKYEEAVVERLGVFNRKIKPGFHFIIPFIEKLRGIEDPKNPKKLFKNGKIPISEQVFNFPKDDRAIFTQNDKPVRLNADVFYQVIDSIKVAYEVDFLFEALNQVVYGIIQKRIIENGSKNTSADDEIALIKEITADISSACNDFTLKWGVAINDFKIRRYTDSKGIRHDFE